MRRARVQLHVKSDRTFRLQATHVDKRPTKLNVAKLLDWRLTDRPTDRRPSAAETNSWRRFDKISIVWPGKSFRRSPLWRPRATQRRICINIRLRIRMIDHTCRRRDIERRSMIPGSIEIFELVRLMSGLINRMTCLSISDVPQSTAFVSSSRQLMFLLYPRSSLNARVQTALVFTWAQY